MQNICCEVTWMQQNVINGEINIGSGNGLLPDGTKAFPESMLIQNYVAIWLH